MGSTSEKSSATLSTNWTKEIKSTLQIKIEDTVIPAIQKQKVLGYQNRYKWEALSF